MQCSVNVFQKIRATAVRKVIRVLWPLLNTLVAYAVLFALEYQYSKSQSTLYIKSAVLKSDIGVFL
jgi:two-component SAPR family response regulator